jgi:protein involved in polysaccharide export with SLBB domain
MKHKSCFFLLGLVAAVWLPVAALADDYRLGVGDGVRVKVYEWPDLNGEYTVSPGGTVSLSVVGEIRAARATPSELAADISTKLKETARLAELPSATVEIVRFRPVFILGEVQAPGEFDSRPGMTVVQAISIAGGIYRRPREVEGNLERERITSMGRLSLLELQQLQHLARVARLDAFLADQETVKFPEELTRRSDDPVVAALIEEERLLLSLHWEAHRDEQATEVDLQTLLEAEVESLERELASVDAQLASAEQELEDVRSLVARGLAPAPRQLGLERTAANIAAQRSGIETSILRARQSVRQSRQRGASLAAERRQRALDLRQTARSELESARRETTTGRRLLLSTDLSSLSRADPNAPVRYRYEITRRTDDGVEVLDGDRMTAVEPGDIIEVHRVMDPPPTGATGDSSAELEVPAFLVYGESAR